MVDLAVVAAVVVIAAVVGLAVHVSDVRRSTGALDDRSTVEGLDVADLFRPLLTLVALLLAFVLVQTFSSFQDASDSASEEATAVLSEAQAARRLTSESAVSIIGALRCYALAVAGPGWDALAATRRTSPVTEEANDRVEAEHVGRRGQQRGVDAFVEQSERVVGRDEDPVWSYDHRRVRKVAVEDRVERLAHRPERRVVEC